MEQVEVNSSRWLSLENLEDERWHVIDDYTNYAVSDYGRIKRLEHDTTKIDKNGVVYHYHFKERVVRLGDSRQGYKLFRPYHECFLYSIRVHRYVAKYFVDNPNNYPIINHIDENKGNNYYKNLEYCTYKMNSNHGTIKERHANAIRKMRRNRKISIDQYTMDGEFVHHYSTKGELDDAGFLEKTVLRVCRHKSESSQGYVWRFGGEPYTAPVYNDSKGGTVRRKVLCYDLKGNLITQYASLLSASLAIGGKNKRTGICECCYGKRQNAYGYIWKYANE